MRNGVPHMKTSLCANVQLNRSNFDFNLKIVTYALFPPGPSIDSTDIKQFIINLFISQANVVCVVYDVTVEESLERVSRVDELKK